ncbi:MAG TPA: M1 family aminopeptidase, partial [Candidatus Krumholzibacterium sp.]|nr:M1 family aminopeptidase [Candidatus Krumholzibacterium sp.]
LHFFSFLYGLYPYVDEKYGVALCSIGGGMEHQTLTSYGAAFTTGTHQYDYVWIHELSHMWFGDLVTCSDWVNIWINEGWASYSEALWFEHIGGPGQLQAYMASRDTPQYWDGPVMRDPSVMDPWYYFNTVVYHKGAWVLHMLRHVMGDTDFFNATRAFLADPRYRFSNADTDEMREIFESYYGAPLDWFFDQWLLRTDRPAYEMTWDYFEVEGSGRLEIGIRQTQGAPYTMPVDLRVFTSSGAVDTVLWVDEIEESFSIVTTDEVTGVTLDPDDWILSDIASSSLTDAGIPALSYLSQNFPNPFNPVTTIGFGLGEESRVRIAVYDLRGRLVRVLTDGVWPAGSHDIVWNGLDSSGVPVASGVYFYRMESGDTSTSKKMVLLR